MSHRDSRVGAQRRTATPKEREEDVPQGQPGRERSDRERSDHGHPQRGGRRRQSVGQGRGDLKGPKKREGGRGEIGRTPLRSKGVGRPGR